MHKFEIQLRDIVMYARHGMLPEERVLGNQYRINVRVRIDSERFEKNPEDLSTTVSYAALFETLKEIMDRPKDLLETVAVEFSEIVKKKWQAIESGEIEIVKVSPPIPGIVGAAGIKYFF